MNKIGKNILILSVANDVCNQTDGFIKTLESKYKVFIAESIDEYEDLLFKKDIGCVLVCSKLQDKSIITSFLSHLNEAPHILITDEKHKRKAQILINKGIKDYVVSSRTSRLFPAINREIEAFAERIKNKQILDELRLSKEVSTMYLENTPLPTISWDLNFNVTLWNKAAINTFGYSAKEAIGKNCLELTVPKGLESKAKEIFNDLISQKGTADNINETLTKSGKIIICHWHNTILENNDGKTIGVISTVEDITDKENIRKAAIKSQRLLESAQKLSEVHFIDISLNTNKVVLDKEFIKLAGFPYKESYTSDFFVKSLIFSKDKIRLLKAIKKALNDKSKLAIDVRVVYKEGTIRWINILADIYVDDKRGHKSLIGTFIDITERKNELHDLEKQRQKLKLTIDIANVGFLELDFETDTVEVSGKAKEIFEIDKDTCNLKEILSRTHPDDKEKLESTIKKARENSKSFQINHRLALPSGAITWVTSTTQVLFDKNNKPVKLLGIFRDITNQINRERRLLQHSLILNQMSSLVMVLDKNTDFIFVSPSVKELTGYDISDVLGQGWWNVSYISVEEKVKAKERFVSVLSGKTSNINNLRYERKILCKNGEVKWFSWQFSKGAENTIIGSAIDITKEKEKEFLVTKLFKALESSPTIVMITDIKGNIEYVNSKFEEVTGYFKEEVIGKNPRILKTGYTPKEEYAKMWQTVLAGKTWHGELKNKKKNGDFFWEKAVITPVKNEEGIVTNFIALKEDITEKKAQEKRFLYALFEAQENEKLKFGEELHDSLSQILSAMSFYLDACLNPNNTKTDLKLGYLEKVKELSVDALRESRHISHGLMSKQLLMGGLVSAVNEICENYNVSRDIKFTFKKGGYKEGILPAQTIQNIYRIIQEITTNIIRHAAASKAHINFTIKNNKWFILEIKDNGIGIDSKKTTYKSKSFGLKNIQQRVTLLNGKIERQSEPNKGTKYTIKIPLVLEILNIL
ncbi:MAG: PAS domain S-box protein [Flavobacteriaceae bacterium]